MTIGTTGIGVRLLVKGTTADSTAWNYYAYDSSTAQMFGIRNDGNMFLPKFANFTSAVAANMYCDGTSVFKSTSSLRYKHNVRDYTRGLADLLSLRPVWFNSRTDEKKETDFAGFIAEEVHDAGLTEFVTYDAQGRPDALNYSHLTALLASAMKELTNRVERLEKTSRPSQGSQGSSAKR